MTGTDALWAKRPWSFCTAGTPAGLLKLTVQDRDPVALHAVGPPFRPGKAEAVLEQSVRVVPGRAAGAEML